MCKNVFTTRIISKTIKPKLQNNINTIYIKYLFLNFHKAIKVDIFLVFIQK